MPASCGFVVPPLGAWTDIVVVPMQAWGMLALWVALSIWFIWRDWPRLPPGAPRRRVILLCILTLTSLCGGPFLTLVYSQSLHVTMTNWYTATVDRLVAYRCPTAELDAAYAELYRNTESLSALFMLGVPISLLLGRGWRNMRIRYLRPRASTQE